MGTKTEAEPGRVPPHDELAEQGVIGACMVDQDAVNYVSDLCTPEDFYVSAHRDIFAAILAVHKDGADVDVLSVKSELERSGVYSRVGGASYIDSLLDVLPQRANVEQYAKRIAKTSQLRSLMLSAEHLRSGCQEQNPDDEIEAAIENVRRTWESGAAADTPMTLHELCRKQYPQASEWLVKGWWLDQACGLWVAEEKSSKTTLALALGMCVAAGRPWLGRWEVKRGPVVAVFEEDHERTIRRRAMMLGRAMGIDPHLDNFHVLCQTGITIGGNRSRGRGRLSALIRRYRPVLIILDPIRRMTPGVDENDSRAVSDYLGWLRRQQKECACAIMCLHHYGKESKEDRMATKPGMRRRLAHRVRGSSDFLAWYDSLILVERDTETNHKINALHRGARKLDEMNVVVDWHDESETITLRLATADSERIAAGAAGKGGF